ncbi:hypothetical protein B0T17DRAFT_381458 [Bombardia bombarda]|uniref:Tyrosinase copper-binding domain-containing protein n=1 Tax=Bombardia bombarda TaxID=252184 RepID=A0AA39WH16_9PEZI|nr:hypothetical protein B0T17DRAFT_381458 [Bombardia bombarda]
MPLRANVTDFWQRWREPQYTEVTTNGEADGAAEKDDRISKPLRPLGRLPVACLLIVAILIALLWVYDELDNTFNKTPKSRPCKNITVRREWRSLDPSEKTNFVNAIHCIAKTPSSWEQNRNTTIYDDFAILHGGIGSWCHRSASFLPWHRYTLAIFENILKTKCGFEGAIPYWDWSLDWANLANSSIWSSSSGFGGDGDPLGTETVGGGRCVTDGPFSDLRPIIYNHTYIPHCISRGFKDIKTNITGQISGRPFSPESMGAILGKQTYKEFVKEVENQLHNSLHQSVNGDFKAMTAANDPLFYVHHAQLDRMWWRWQREKPEVRLHEYSGRHMFNSTNGTASVNDMLLYAGFAKDMPVASVMDTEGRFLCYRYMY